MSERFIRDPEHDWKSRPAEPRLDQSADRDIENRLGPEKYAELQGWLGQSIVTVGGEPGGAPLTMYHYSRTENQPLDPHSLYDDRYDPERFELGLHLGIALTAELRSYQESSSGRTYALVAKVEHPLYTENQGLWKVSELSPNFTHNLAQAVQQNWEDAGIEVNEPLIEKLTQATATAEVLDTLQEAGFDGIIYRNNEEHHGSGIPIDSVIVFDPANQLRNALTGEPIMDEAGNWC